MLIIDPFFFSCEIHVITGAVYCLAPIVIVFPSSNAFKMPFVMQLRYDLIYHWNVLLITALTAQCKIHLHLFICQLGFIKHFASAFGSWRDVFFTSTMLPFLVFQPKLPRFTVLALKTYKCTYLDQEKISLCDSVIAKEEWFSTEI